MATSEWGLFEWGAAEWGSGESEASSPNMAASGTIQFSGTASLQLARTFDAAGTIQITGTAALTTEIKMAASGEVVMTGAGNLQVARFATNLHDCGDPLSTACQEFFP